MKEEKMLICPECEKDKNIFCPRNTDGKCNECGYALHT